MPILTIVLTLIVIGVLLYLVNTYIPLEPMFKKLINIVVIIATCVWLLKIVGLWAYLTNVRI